MWCWKSETTVEFAVAIFPVLMDLNWLILEKFGDASVCFFLTVTSSNLNRSTWFRIKFGWIHLGIQQKWIVTNWLQLNEIRNHTASMIPYRLWNCVDVFVKISLVLFEFPVSYVVAMNTTQWYDTFPPVTNNLTCGNAGGQAPPSVHAGPARHRKQRVTWSSITVEGWCRHEPASGTKR